MIPRCSIMSTIHCITIRKTPLVYQPCWDQPTAKGLKSKRHEYSNVPNNSLHGPLPIHVIGEVSIACLEVDGKQFAQYRLMSDSMALPDTQCWFYVAWVYPWLLQNNTQDVDRILTDGETYYLVSRDLADSPFILNDFTKDLISRAISKFVEKI